MSDTNTPRARLADDTPFTHAPSTPPPEKTTKANNQRFSWWRSVWTRGVDASSALTKPFTSGHSNSSR